MLASRLMQRITAVTRGDLRGRRPPPPREFDSLPTQKAPFVLFRVIDHPEIFLKAPWAPIYTNFEGERAPKKNTKFLSKFSINCLKTPFSVCFFEKFGQNRVFVVLWEGSENQSGRPKKTNTVS